MIVSFVREIFNKILRIKENEYTKNNKIIQTVYINILVFIVQILSAIVSIKFIKNSLFLLEVFRERY